MSLKLMLRPGVKAETTVWTRGRSQAAARETLKAGALRRMVGLQPDQQAGEHVVRVEVRLIDLLTTAATPEAQEITKAVHRAAEFCWTVAHPMEFGYEEKVGSMTTFQVGFLRWDICNRVDLTRFLGKEILSFVGDARVARTRITLSQQAQKLPELVAAINSAIDKESSGLELSLPPGDPLLLREINMRYRGEISVTDGYDKGAIDDKGAITVYQGQVLKAPAEVPPSDAEAGREFPFEFKLALLKEYNAGGYWTLLSDGRVGYQKLISDYQDGQLLMMMRRKT